MLLLQAILIGAIVSLGAIGITNLIAMRRCFIHGWKSGFLVGLGSAFADLMYAAVPAFGLRFVAEYATAWESYLTLFAAIIMIGTGLYFSRKNIDFSANNSRWQSAGGFGIGFLINAFSPGNLIAYGIGFSMLSVEIQDLTTLDGLWLTLGVFIGSVAAWALKIMLFMYLRKKITEARLNTINKGFGVFMIVVGIGILIYALV